VRRLLLAVALLLLLLPASALAAAGDPQDKVVAYGDVVIAPGETVGDVVVIHGDVLVRGTVHGDIVDIDGTVTIRGAVAGDVVTITKQAVLGRRAHVGGDVKFEDKRPAVSPGAVIGGKTERLSDTSSFGVSDLKIAIGFWVIATVSLLLTGLLLLLLAPRAADAIVRAARSGVGVSIIAGIVLLIVFPLLAIVLLITVVGTPLGIGMLLVFGPLLAIGYLSSALVLGRRFVKTGGRTAAFLLGILVLRLIALIPFLGALVSLIATVFGLGAVFVATRRARTA
jgi:cytoskeletal protein CcmA (bactofilin family)